MNRRFLLGCSALCAGLSMNAVASNIAAVTGKAYSISGEELLYVEQHRWTSNELRLVRYLSPAGHVIAKKSVNYQQSRTSPNVEQVNDVAGELIRVTRLEGGKTQIDYRAKDGEKITSETLSTPAKQVVDAGFDEFVLTHWESLSSGSKLAMEFVAPSRQTHVRFAIKQKPCADENTDTVCFQIKPTGFIYRLALDPIDLTYQRSSQRLLRFVGMGNIADKSGDYLNVDIRYEYHDLKHMPELNTVSQTENNHAD